MNLLDAVNQSFSEYAGMTIQDRAIVDARDGLKPSQRQCMYAQYIEKITYKKPFKKSNKSVAAALDHYYIHGDSSCYALLTRMAKVFSMRYPYIDFDGSYGTITSGNSEAASRYTEMRLGELGCNLFENIEKDCIDLWYDNYDNTEQFPSVVPSLGFYGICNGAMGIATGLSTSIPQYNVKEVNNALIKLLWNPEIDFEEIYCPPDFCTGATILNSEQVKESHRNGCGKAAIIRSEVIYDEKENCLYVTEIPYGVYTGTICSQIKENVENGELIGIKNVLDLSTKKANIKIILEKNINVNQIIKKLYKLTSLQDSYTINLVMLDKGRYPKTFTWKEALNAHLDHEKRCYTAIHKYELKRINKRINIVEGILIALANIDEVVSLIRQSKNKNEAKSKLIERFGFNDEQADSILKITLSRLVNLEIQNFKDEKDKLLKEQEHHQHILSNESELFKEIENGLRTIANKYGDERRTRLVNLDFKNEGEDEEPIEEKELLIYYTNLGNIYTQESSTLVKTRRGGKGSKIKMQTNETILQTISDTNFNHLLAFSNKGKMFTISINELPINSKININQLFELESGETITTITSGNKKKMSQYLVFITKNGLIKKTAAKEYEQKRGKFLKAINLVDGDEVIDVLLVSDGDKIGLLTNNQNFVVLSIDDISAIGRLTKGVKGVSLSEGNFVISSHIIKNSSKYLVVVSKNGLIKKSPIEDFPVCGRATKGRKISEIHEDDKIVNFLTLNEDCDIIIITKIKTLKISTQELRLLSRAALGVKAINLSAHDEVIDIIGG